MEQKQLNYVLRAQGLGLPQQKMAEVHPRPGLYKIFDEILVNAADNYVRDNSQTYIKVLQIDLAIFQLLLEELLMLYGRAHTLQVTINEREGCISIENNGRGLPVEAGKVGWLQGLAGEALPITQEHKEHQMYVPEMASCSACHSTVVRTV